MDSLKSLLDSRKYDLVIKLTEGSTKGEDLFYRIAAFICLSKYEEALFVIQDHQEILEKTNMASLIKVHIELLCALERYEQAYASLDYYSNLPYQSQVVEEVLRDMSKVIAREEKKVASKYISDDDVVDKLHSKEKEEVLFAIDLIRKRDIFTYLSEIAKVMVSNESQFVRSLALMLLVEKEVDREMKFLSSFGLITINPKFLKAPFTGEHFNRVLRIMDHTFKDTSLSQNGAQILSSYTIYNYPKDIEKDEEEIALAIYYIARKMMSFDTDLESEAKNKNLDIEKVKRYIDEINNCVEQM